MEPDFNQIIKTAVQNIPDMNAKEKQECEKLMHAVLEEGKTPAEALGLGEQELECFYSIGYNLYKSGKFKEANNIFNSLCHLNATRSKYWYGLAASFHKLKKYERAKECYMSWSYLEPDDPLPFFHASDCCIMLDQKRQAIMLLGLAIQLCGETHVFQPIKEKAKATLEGLKTQVAKEEK